MNVKIEVIPHDQHRYPTVGDWYFEGEDIVIRVSQLSDWRREMLVAVHELVEVILCKQAGITQEATDAFDQAFEAKRAADLDCSAGELTAVERARLNAVEPGDEPTAPYVKQHCIATGIERILSAELGVSWKDYENELEQLP